MNKVIISGTSTKDTELQTSANGTPYCRFTLAVNRDYNDEEGNPITDFFNFVVFKQQAEFLAKYLTKGSKACVEGTLITTERELKDGSRIKQIDIRVKNVELFYIKRRDQQQDDETLKAEKVKVEKPAKPAAKPRTPNVPLQPAIAMTEMSDEELPF